MSFPKIAVLTQTMRIQAELLKMRAHKQYFRMVSLGVTKRARDLDRSQKLQFTAEM